MARVDIGEVDSLPAGNPVLARRRAYLLTNQDVGCSRSTEYSHRGAGSALNRTYKDQSIEYAKPSSRQTPILLSL